MKFFRGFKIIIGVLSRTRRCNAVTRLRTGRDATGNEGTNLLLTQTTSHDMLSLLFNRVAPRTISQTGNVNVLRRVLATPCVRSQLVSRTFLTSIQLASPVAATKASTTKKGTSTAKSSSAKKPAKKKAKASKPSAAENAKSTHDDHSVSYSVLHTRSNLEFKFTAEELPPKRPLSAYLRFTISKGSFPNSVESVRERAREAGKQWHALSDAEKQVFSLFFLSILSIQIELMWPSWLAFFGRSQTGFGRISKSTTRIFQQRQ